MTEFRHHGPYQDQYMNRTIRVTTGGSQHGTETVQFDLIGPTGAYRATFNLTVEDVLEIAQIVREDVACSPGRQPGRTVAGNIYDRETGELLSQARTGLLPTTVTALRLIAAERREDVKAAERHLTYYEGRAGDAEETLRRAEQGIAPPGFYLADN